MRLHRLEVEAFGPFAERVVVDLDAVSAGGLFLVHGPTGSGKTSLLDAVCFALYADVPGARGKQGLRSDHAEPEVRPEVVLELTVAGRRLRITRSPGWNRPKKRGTGTTPVQATVVLEEYEGASWRALSTRNDEVADVVKDLLGMGLRQFASVVLLPQGDFATFLRADPDDRRALLEKLFDIGVFADVEQWLAEARRSGASALDAARSGLDTDLLRLDDALAQVPGLVGDDPDDPEGTDAGEGAGPTAVLVDPAPGTLPDRLAAVDATLQDRLTASLTAVDAAESAETAALAGLDAARALLTLRTRGTQARQRLEALEAEADQHAGRRDELGRGERAAAVSGHLSALDRAVADVDAAQDEAAVHRRPLATLLDDGSGDGSAAALLERVHALDPAAEALEREAGPARDLADRLTRTSQRRESLAEERDDVAAALPGLREAEQEAAAEVARLGDEAARLGSLDTTAAVQRARLAALDEVEAGRERIRDLTPRLLATGDDRLSAQTALYDLRQQRLDQMAAELAADLAAGEPCPVCGGLEHPVPAVATDPVTPAALEAAETRLDQAQEQYLVLEGEVRALEAAVGTRLEDLGDTDRETLGAALAATTAEADAARGARAALGAAERQHAEHRRAAGDAAVRLERILATLEQLDEQVEQLSAEADASLQRLTAAMEAHSDCPCATGDPAGHRRVRDGLTRLVRAEADLLTAQERCAAAESDLIAALDDAGLASADEARAAARDTSVLDRLRDAVQAHERGLDAARSVLAEADVVAALAADEPDLDTLAGAAAAARDRSIEARLTLEAVGRAARSLAELRPGLERRCAELADGADRQARITELAEVARGTGAENTLRMPLTSYVLASRLDTVARLANERLAVMGAGRYSLEHSDARASHGRRGGLGLKVLDQWTGRVRDTASLSGGESFMASLALALGLADAVREEVGGRDLGTLFVDEGFGTLDDESLEQVLAVLDALREGGRAVGVVSHVADLRARVPHQVVVSKGVAGSSVTTRTEADAPAA